MSLSQSRNLPSFCLLFVSSLQCRRHLSNAPKFNFRPFRSNCGLGAVERERALLKIAIEFVKFDIENRLPAMAQGANSTEKCGFENQFANISPHNELLKIDYFRYVLASKWDLK